MLEPTESQSSINIGGNSQVTITDGDMVGGHKYVSVGGVTLQLYVNGNLPLETQLAFFSSELGMRSIRAAKFTSSQFEAYSATWKSLQALNLAGEDLWENPNPDNVVTFTKQLRETKLTVQEGELYFDDADRNDLLRVLDKLSDYGNGKERLVDYYAELDRLGGPQYVTEQMQRDWEYMGREITRQINLNGKYRLEYQQILERIRLSFRGRLAN